MRDFKLFIGYILIIIGFLLMAVANIAAIGTGLYEWAFNVDLPIAAWNAFVLWMQMMGGGVVSLIIGLILGEGRLSR